MKYTTNYALEKPDPNDVVDIRVINRNMDKMDAEVAKKADKSDLDNINIPVQSVNGKTGDVVLSAIDIKAADGKTLEQFKYEATTQMNNLENNKISKNENVEIENTYPTFGLNGTDESIKFRAVNDLNSLFIQGVNKSDGSLATVLQYDFANKNINLDGNIIWHAGNDGSGSGLDADTVDGKHAFDFAPSGYGLGTTCANISGQDLNTDRGTGFYMGDNLLNAPTSDWYYIEHLQHNTLWYLQIATRLHTNDRYMRRKYGGTWQPWVKILTEDNIGQKLTGVITYNEDISPGSTLTKTIAIGNGYKNGKLIYKDNQNGCHRGMVFFNTTQNITKSAIIIPDSGYSGAYRPDFRSEKFNLYLGDLYDPDLFFDNAYISGNNIVITFVNTSGFYKNLNITIDWEVEK